MIQSGQTHRNKCYLSTNYTNLHEFYILKISRIENKISLFSANSCNSWTFKTLSLFNCETPVISRAPLKNQIVNYDRKMQKRFLTAFEMTPHFTGEQSGSSGGEAAATPAPLFSAKRPSFRSEARNLSPHPVIGTEGRNLAVTPVRCNAVRNPEELAEGNLSKTIKRQFERRSP